MIPPDRSSPSDSINDAFRFYRTQMNLSWTLERLHCEKKSNMANRTNTYRLTLEQVSLAKEDVVLQTPLHLEFENHDEIFGIIKTLNEKNPFGDVNQSTEFAIGLKMFSEVMLKNKAHPLFKEFLPAMGVFMKKLKSS